MTAVAAASTATAGAPDGVPSYVAYACLYGLGGLYVVPMGLSWLRMWRNLATEDRTAVRLFGLLGLGSLLRALAFVLVAIWMLAVLLSSGSHRAARHLHLSYVQLVTAWQVLGMLASIVLVSVFLLVFNTWASMIEQVNAASTPASASTSRGLGGITGAAAAAVSSLSSSSGSRGLGLGLRGAVHVPPRVLFIRMVLVTNALQMLTFFVTTDIAALMTLTQSLNLFATMLLAACFGVCIFLLPAYGARMCELLGKVAEGAERRQRNVRRITAISTVFFLMRTLTEVLLSASEYAERPTANATTYPTNAPPWRVPHRRIRDANPIFFFAPPAEASPPSTAGFFRWVVLLEVVEFPIEWTLLMGLLCVLPARAVLPSIRGYQSISDFKRRYP